MQFVPARQCNNPPCRIFHIQTLAMEQAESSQFAKFQSLCKMLSLTTKMKRQHVQHISNTV